MAHRPNDRKFFRSADRQDGQFLEKVKPYLRSAVQQRYGDGKEINICPGEANCDRWAASAGKTHAKKEANACHPCEFFPTKTLEGRAEHAALENLTITAFQIRRRRKSGYPVGTNELTALELEAAMLVDELIDHEELKLRFEMKSALIAGFGLKTQ